MISKMTKPPLDYLSELFGTVTRVETTQRDGSRLLLDQSMDSASGLILSVKGHSGKVMLIGNGGSAAIASHAHNDLCKAAGIKAIVFNEQPLLTAISNDDGYNTVFERPVRLWAEKDDVLLAISSSGKSENIIRAVTVALETGCRVVTFSGFRADNPLRRMGEVNFYIPAENYGYVEVAHMALIHYLTDRAMLAKTRS